MRVYILFSDDPIFKPRLLNDILLHDSFECCGVGEVTAPTRGGFVAKLKYNWKFWGFGALLFISANHYFRNIVGRLGFISPSISGLLSIKNVCRSYGYSYRQISNVNEKSFVDELQEMQPDVILSFQHQIFRKRILSIPNTVCINCHPALLPAYRGVKPIFWAMFNQEDTFGVTVHTMTSEIDCGKIVSQIRIPLNLQNTMFQNYKSAYSLSTHVILQAIDKLKTQDVLNLPDIPENASYFRDPSYDDIRQFRQKGLRLF